MPCVAVVGYRGHAYRFLQDSKKAGGVRPQWGGGRATVTSGTCSAWGRGRFLDWGLGAVPWELLEPSLLGELLLCPGTSDENQTFRGEQTTQDSSLYWL